MIERFVAVCMNRRWLVVAIFVMVGIFGYYSWTTLSIEAYPDIADTTAQVITQFPGHAAEEIEEQITIPLERELNGIPGLSVMRSRSTFGLSLITLVFRDGIDDYFARTRIRERLAGVQLPDGVQPDLDPLSAAEARGGRPARRRGTRRSHGKSKTRGRMSPGSDRNRRA